MKTKNRKRIVKFLIVILPGILMSAHASAQFIESDTIDQTPIDERKGVTSTYTVPGPDTDQYSWEVTGGTIVSPEGATGSGTADDPYVLPFTIGLQSIDVEWPEDDSTINSLSGKVSTQRQVAHSTISCPSSIQSLSVSLWSMPKIAIRNSDEEICSGDATSGSVAVDFVGAPGFDFKYTITGTDGEEGAEQIATGISGSSSTIEIPDNLLNTSTTEDQYFIVRITEMNDAFLGSGTIVDSDYTVTVHPTIETGEISSSNGLSRRE